MRPPGVMRTFAITWTVLLTLTPRVARAFGTIQIRWDTDASIEGRSHPTVVMSESEEEDSTEADAEMTHYQSEEDAYEDAWWRGGFAEDSEATWFAASPEVRYERPQSVVFEVGTVYQHATSGALGVVVGWDARTRAPRAWTRYNAGQLGVTLKRLHAPHYSVLEERREVDGESLRFMTRYIVGDWIRVLQSDTAPLHHPDLAHFFSGYDHNSGRYMPEDWLRQRYPHG